jgi:hypothetical protein
VNELQLLVPDLTLGSGDQSFTGITVIWGSKEPKAGCPDFVAELYVPRA